MPFYCHFSSLKIFKLFKNKDKFKTRAYFSDKSSMRILIFFVLFLSSCQSVEELKQKTEELKQQVVNNLQDWREFAVTQIASQGAKQSFTPQNIQDILYLFLDLKQAENCTQIKTVIVDNVFLQNLESQLDLQSGFLFYILANDYDYEKSLLQYNRNTAEKATYSIVSTWKSYFSLRELNAVISRISSCKS